jgi:hypothetical protein
MDEAPYAKYIDSILCKLGDREIKDGNKGDIFITFYLHISSIPISPVFTQFFISA